MGELCPEVTAEGRCCKARHASPAPPSSPSHHRSPELGEPPQSFWGFVRDIIYYNYVEEWEFKKKKKYIYIYFFCKNHIILFGKTAAFDLLLHLGAILQGCVCTLGWRRCMYIDTPHPLFLPKLEHLLETPNPLLCLHSPPLSGLPWQRPFISWLRSDYRASHSQLSLKSGYCFRDLALFFFNSGPLFPFEKKPNNNPTTPKALSNTHDAA